MDFFSWELLGLAGIWRENFVILLYSTVYCIVYYAGFIEINIQFIIQMCSSPHINSS